MPEFLKSPFNNGPTVAPLDVLIKLLVAMCLGSVVAWLYARTRNRAELTPSFPATLVLLTILIAMVTQTIGDNVARAFSLVGALSIVRFRTIVRDTQDTAFVICAVVVGMAIGAKNPWVAVIGLAVVGAAAFLMVARTESLRRGSAVYRLTLRVGIGHDMEELFRGAFDTYLERCEALSISTARQGVSLEAKYQTCLRPERSPDELVKALNRLDGVQHVELARQDVEWI